jgi:hypothetical protein
MSEKKGFLQQLSDFFLRPQAYGSQNSPPAPQPDRSTTQSDGPHWETAEVLEKQRQERVRKEQELRESRQKTRQGIAQSYG